MIEEGSSRADMRQWLGSQLMGRPHGSPAGGASPRAEGPSGALDLGYLVLRCPEGAGHLRGHHRCDWGALMLRLGVDRSRWQENKKGYYIRCYTTQEAAQALWQAQRLALPVPLDPS